MSLSFALVNALCIAICDHIIDQPSFPQKTELEFANGVQSSTVVPSDLFDWPDFHLIRFNVQDKWPIEIFIWKNRTFLFLFG